MLLIFGFYFVGFVLGVLFDIFFFSFFFNTKLELDKMKMKSFHLLVIELFDRRCNLVFELYLACVSTDGLHHQSM